MSLIQRFLLGNRVDDDLQVGLFLKNDGTVWLRNPDKSETQITGGSGSVTDETVQFAVGGPDPDLLPIVAVSQVEEAPSFTVAGDQTATFGSMGAVFNGAPAQVTGSTGNDGGYPIDHATYDAGSDQTTIFVAALIPDGTADGSIQGAVIFTADVVLPANSAVEWVLVETEESWDADDGFYGVVGDLDDPAAFVSGVSGFATGGLNATDPGVWQWPALTVAKSGAGVVALGTLTAIKFYPDGGTVKIVFVSGSAGTTGQTKVVVHHHFTEPVTPTRIPAVS